MYVYITLYISLVCLSDQYHSDSAHISIAEIEMLIYVDLDWNLETGHTM